MLEIETEIALLKSDVTRMTSLFEKLDTAIEKMGDVSNSIARMLAVHEEKLNKQERIDQELFTLVEKRKAELQVDVKELHSRISTVQRELSGDISETETRLMDALKNGMHDIKMCITEEHEGIKTQRNELEDRIRDLEKWRWIILGGSIVLGAFARDIFSKLFNV
jgi:chromosome segregation ATPase